MEVSINLCCKTSEKFHIFWNRKVSSEWYGKTVRVTFSNKWFVMLWKSSDHFDLPEVFLIIITKKHFICLTSPLFLCFCCAVFSSLTSDLKHLSFTIYISGIITSFLYLYYGLVRLATYVQICWTLEEFTLVSCR